MPSEQLIAVVIFLVLLAMSVAGYLKASRDSDRLDRQLHRSDPERPRV
jgi:type II secretory pathway component PulJ